MPRNAGRGLSHWQLFHSQRQLSEADLQSPALHIRITRGTFVNSLRPSAITRPPGDRFRRQPIYPAGTQLQSQGIRVDAELQSDHLEPAPGPLVIGNTPDSTANPAIERNPDKRNCRFQTAVAGRPMLQRTLGAGWPVPTAEPPPQRIAPFLGTEPGPRSGGAEHKGFRRFGGTCSSSSGPSR